MIRVNKIEISAEEIQTVFNYDYKTGAVNWRLGNGYKIKAGDPAGSLSNNGYLRIEYKRQKYQAHRLVWVYIYGKIPNNMFIDHINGNRADNRLCNLRLCTWSENQKNASLRKDNKTRYKGVYAYGINGKYRIQILNPSTGKRENYCSFNTLEDASNFYAIKASEYYGEFYRDTRKENND